MTGISVYEEMLERNLDRYPVGAPSVLDADVQKLCRGDRSLRAMLPQLDAEVLARILDTAVWLDAPLAPTAKPRPGAPRTLVLAVHPEDGFAAMGGYLLNHRGWSDCMYVVMRNPSHGRGDGIQSSMERALLRRDEASLMARMTGVNTLWVNLPPKKDGRMSGASIPSILYDLMGQHDAADVFVPAPLGKDPDRACLFEAVMRIYAGGYFKSSRFHVYESFPGAERHIEIDDFLSLTENRYIRLQPWSEPISEILEGKSQLVQLMRTMPGASWDVEVLKVARRAGSLIGSGTGYAERFWTLQLTFGRS